MIVKNTFSESEESQFLIEDLQREREKIGLKMNMKKIKV